MEHVRWTSRPPLQRPVVIVAFEGWNDAGEAGSTAARWLRDRWAPRPVAEIDPEEFFDFTTTRPQVVLVDGQSRRIEWPVTTVTAGSTPTVGDTLVVLGTEPQLRWRTFSDVIVELAGSVGARLVVTLGALFAEVPHTRPTSIIGTAVDQEVLDRHDLRRSTYEGPTGILGVLHDRCAAAGLPSASLWAAVPAYVPGAPSPKAALALVERTADMLDVPVVATDLEIAAASYERQVSEVVVDDEEMSHYVERLEARYEAGFDDDDEDEDDEEGGNRAGGGLPSPQAFVDEVERFLREQPGND